MIIMWILCQICNLPRGGRWPNNAFAAMCDPMWTIQPHCPVSAFSAPHKIPKCEKLSTHRGAFYIQHNLSVKQGTCWGGYSWAHPQAFHCHSHAQQSARSKSFNMWHSEFRKNKAVPIIEMSLQHVSQ